MPKKPKEPIKCRKWEKDRRNRLKEKFLLLAKVLPCYDPSIKLCHEFILENARITIELLLDEVDKVLSKKPEIIKDIKDDKIKRLEEKIKKLLTRNEQLCNLLREAGIAFPKVINGQKTVNKLAQNPKKKPKLATTVAPKHRSEKKSAEPRKKRVNKKTNIIETTTGSVCVYLLSQPTTVTAGITQPYYLITNPQLDRNLVTNTSNTPHSASQTVPLVNVNPMVRTINPGTLYFTNNPIVPQSQLILPSTTPLISIPKTVATVSTLPKIITTPNVLPQSQIILPPSNSLSTTILKPLVTVSSNISTNSVVPVSKALTNPPLPIPTTPQTAPVSISLESDVLVSASNSLSISTSSSTPNIILTSAISVTNSVSIPFVSVSKTIPTTLVSVVKTVSTPFVSESKSCNITYTPKSTTITSNIDANQKKIEKCIKKLPVVVPKRRCFTRTTQANKVPIPALTSNYANSYLLLNDVTPAPKKDIKVIKVLKVHGKKVVKRKAENQQENNVKMKCAKEASNIKNEENKNQIGINQITMQSEHSLSLDIVSMDVDNEPTIKTSDRYDTQVGPKGDPSADSNIPVSEINPSSEEVSDILKKDTTNFSGHVSNVQNDTNASLDKVPTIITTVVSTPLPTYSVATTTSCPIPDAHDDIKNLELNLVHSELSNDLFASLHVPPPGCQNPESTSPTAAFLLAFPLVSSLKVSEVMEEDNSDSHRGTPTLLQIGTMDITKTTQSDNLSNTLLNLEHFNFFSGKNIYSEFYTPFNVANGTQNIGSDSNKQNENNNVLNDSFISYIDKNSEQKMENTGISSKTCNGSTKFPNKSGNLKANLNSCTKHEKKGSLEVQKQISENPSDNFSNDNGKQKSVLSVVHPQDSLNVTNWSSTTDFNVGYAVQENTGDIKNDIVLNEKVRQNYETQTNGASQKEQILTSNIQNSLHLQYNVEQKMYKDSRKGTNNIQMETSTNEEISGNKNQGNQKFTEQNSSSTSNMSYQNTNKEKDNTITKNNQCNTEYISQQFTDSKNKAVESSTDQKIDKWISKPTQEVLKNVEHKLDGVNRVNKTTGTPNNHIIHNFNTTNQNAGVWPLNHYQSKMNGSVNIGVQNSSNTDNKNNSHYRYQQSSSSTQNLQNANDKENLCGWPRNSQEPANQNYCEKHRPQSTIDYNKSQETQFNSNLVSENLPDNSKNQPSNYWPMDSRQFNSAYNNSVPFGIRQEKLDSSKKHGLIQNTSDNQKNNIQYPHQATSNSCNDIGNKKHNIWTQEWPDVNISYNTFKEMSDKDVQKQTHHTWSQEIMNYTDQNSGSTPQKYQMNQEVPVANKKESLNASWSAVPTPNTINNFEIQHTIPNVQYMNQQKEKHSRKNVQNVTDNKTQNIQYNIQKEIPNMDSGQASKLWSIGSREFQNYEKHRSDFINHYNMQEKPKDMQNLSNNNEKLNVNAWPVYPPKENAGKICEKHRNNDFSQTNVKFSLSKTNNYGNSCDNVQKTNPTPKTNSHQNIPEQNFDIFLATAKDHLNAAENSSKKINNVNTVNSKQTENYSGNYSKKSSTNIENINKSSGNMNKIVDQHLKVQPTHNSTKTGDQSQKEIEQKSQCYFSTTYSSSSCNFNYRADTSKSCPTCSYVHLNRNYANPLYTNSNNYNYNYSDPTFNQGYYKPPISKTEANYYPFNYDTYQDTSKYYRHSHNFARDSGKNNTGDKCNKEEGVVQNKPVNWMTTPGNKVQTSECLLPTFSNQSYSFTSCITTGEGSEPNEPKKNSDFSEDKQFTWSPTKFPNFLDTSHNFVTPTLPTLVGDLALGNPLTFPDQKTDYSKYPKESKRKSGTCDGQPGNFLSVSQLVDHNKSENVPARTTTRRNSGGRSKGTASTKKSKILKNTETSNDKVNQNKQVGSSSSSSNVIYNIEGQTDLFYEQKSRNPTKNISSNYSAEALIGSQASEINNKKLALPNKALGSSSFLTENIVTYFPTVDENYTMPGQNFQNNTFSHNNLQNTTYATNSFIYTASTIPSTYLANSFEPNLTDFSSDNLNMVSGPGRDNTKIDNTKNFRQSVNNKDDKQNNCQKRANKKKQLVETGSTGVGSALASFDYPFLVPASTNSPILPEDFHSHTTFLPPTGTAYPCKATLYQKQPNDFNPNPLLPLPGLPRTSVPHPEVSPSINSAGTSFTNFNLSTIFPEINKASTNAVFQDNGLKDTSVSNSLQVPFNVEPKYSFSS